MCRDIFDPRDCLVTVPGEIFNKLETSLKHLSLSGRRKNMERDILQVTQMLVNSLYNFKDTLNTYHGMITNMAMRRTVDKVDMDISKLKESLDTLKTSLEVLRDAK